MNKKATGKFEDRFTYQKTITDKDSKIEIWVSNTQKIDYDQLYEVMIASHKQRAAEVLNDGM